MALTNKIDWQQESWNPTTGCTPISKGCKNCYALSRAKKLRENGYKSYTDGFELKLHRERLNKPFTFKKPSRIFVDSMSDLFHEDVPLEFIQQVFDVIRQCPQHLFLIVTKRAEVLVKYSNDLNWYNNIIIAVTVEHSDYKYRLDLLRKVPVKNKAVFFEPLLDEIGEVDLSGIKWAFVGGESGMNYRPVKKEWIYQVKEQCDKQGCTFIFKQWGGLNRFLSGNELDGKLYHNIPTVDNVLQPTLF
ncbi:protein gp37 [Draconibacterium orientale]|uniref:Protein gp37 n=1 Tax=Draconibacterium orientale TaxID=1168034 RepID=X5E236_9BACT|nr:phage Gp37/Gp68 family protein [Draconibacterium orientale]AHW60651.1 hypothetical protein FH5T_16175 [Draconibacterium orientale]SET79042.1 protein gp37 [Draconibacterium orientale]